MQTAGLLPAWAHSAVVRSNPAALDETFGTLCITIMRDARVFIAPMTDLGLGARLLRDRQFARCHLLTGGPSRRCR